MPNEILHSIIKGNLDFSRQKPNEEFNLTGQKPQVTMISCSDSRVSGNIFGMDECEKVFTIRNIGNQLRTAEGSVEYGINHLHTPVLLIMGHTGCGAIHAALGDFSEESEPIRIELEVLHDTLERYKFNDMDSVVRETRYSQANVDEQVGIALSKFGDAVDAGKLTIVGALFDFHDIFTQNRGEIFIININGEKDVDKLKKEKVLDGLEDMIEKRVKRI